VRLDVDAFAFARTAEERSEDAWAVDVEQARLAVADGASSAWRAGDWAATLVDAWIERPPSRPRGRGSATDVLAWVDLVREGFDVPGDGEERAWFTEAAAARGAHAALLGAVVTGLSGRRPRLLAVAIGDVCLMLVRGGRLERSFPVDDPDAFGTRPALVSSLAGGGPAAADVVVHEGALRVGDVLLIASDALAAALLRIARTAPEVWDVVARVDGAAFHALVEQSLAAGVLERDDVTLLRAVVRDGSDA